MKFIILKIKKSLKNSFKMKRKNNQYVIGVDGGGSKTVAVLANLEGKILARAQTGSASPRNVGLSEAMANVAKAIEKVLKRNKKVSSVFLGLPCLEEEFKNKKGKIKKELLKHKEISSIFKGKVIIGSDQLVGFRSGTDKKEGMVLIAGSGSVLHGWSGKKEIKISGWGYLTEKGSAFWIGQKGLIALWEELDGLGPKTLITKLIFKKLKIKNKEELIEKVYSKNLIKNILSFSVLVDEAAEKKDKVAKNILIEAAKELALFVKIAIKKLNLPRSKKNLLEDKPNEKIPLVLIGGMFKSKIILREFKKEVKKFAPKIEFILPKKEPVIGAVKLAIEKLNNAI